jgi:hypothetical protein
VKEFLCAILKNKPRKTYEENTFSRIALLISFFWGKSNLFISFPAEVFAPELHRNPKCSSLKKSLYATARGNFAKKYFWHY